MSQFAPSDEHLRAQYLKREKTFVAACEKDQNDVREALERERRFMVEWHRLSTNHYLADEPGPAVVLFIDSVEQYKSGKRFFPWDRDVNQLTIYGQIWDYFMFMWNRTKPYKVVALIILLTTVSPIQTFLLGYISNQIKEDPAGTPIWLYLSPFFLKAATEFIYWWYEMWVPLNSQRYQLRCILLTQRVGLPENHPLARRWTAGRFNGLLKDVDELVNGVWKGCLEIIEMVVTVCWTLALCMANVAADLGVGTDLEDLTGADYGIYVTVFLMLGIIVLALPFFWFRLFMTKLSECETMVQEGQAMYLSASTQAVAAGDANVAERPRRSNGVDPSTTIEAGVENESITETGRRAFRVFGFTTFRSFFFRHAWTTNYNLLTTLWGPFVAYGLLTQREFGSQSITSTIIILQSLKVLTDISARILSLLAVMAKGCRVLLDVAELLNIDMKNLDGSKQETTS